MQKLKRKILFFIADVVPTDDQLKQALEIGASFRAVKFINKNTPVEKCDAVCGVIPEQYRELVEKKELEVAKLPKVEAALKGAGTAEEKDTLKATLDEREIKYASNASLETLKKLVASSEPDPLG